MTYDTTAFSASLSALSHGFLPDSFPAADAAERLGIICRCLEQGAAQFNLTAITDADEVMRKHILDSLFAAAKIAELSGGREGTLLDVGSGAGFPALPVAAALPTLRVTALDSTAKKTRYIRQTADAAGIGGFSSVCARAEDFARGPGREAFDFVSARAVAHLPVLMELCAPCVAVGGYFIAMKGASAMSEAAQAAHAAGTLSLEACEPVAYTLPDMEDERFLLIYRKISPVSSLYPRNYSQISKKPL